MKDLKETLAKADAKAANSNKKEENTMGKEQNVQKVSENKADVAKNTKKVAKNTKKGEKQMKGQPRAMAVLQKVAKATKGVHMNNKGTQIIDDQTNEVKCAVCRHAAKVTMPLPRKDGVRPCEGNKHMSWIPFDHPKLEALFTSRLKSKKTMLQFEAEQYDGKPSPARAKALRQGKTAAETVKDIDAKLKALQEQKKALQKELKTKSKAKAKTTKAKGTKAAKATA